MARRKNDEIVVETKKLALFVDKFTHVKPFGEGIMCDEIKVFLAGTYTTDQVLIKELIQLNAPIEIYKKVC